MEPHEIQEIKALIKDKNYRIILSKEGINIFNSESHKIGSDPYDFYDSLKVENDASHAFYLGVEIARAQIAHQLGKNYNQDNELEWGLVSEKKEEDLLSRPEMKSTQKKK